MSELLLRGGLMVDPASGIAEPRDIAVSGGRIEAIAPPGQLTLAAGADALSADGWWVMPGLIDVHVHLRDPGFPLKETIRSGLAAAAAGGFTAVAAMANTEPVNDNPEVAAYMLRSAAACAGTALYPVGAVTRGLRGLEAVDYAAMAQAGTRMFSDDGIPIDDPALLLRALNQTASLGFVISLHEEERARSAGRAINDGPIAGALGVGGIPEAAEVERVRRDLAIAIGAGCPVHIAHVSAAATVDLIRAARARGANVTCEATPHHFALQDASVLEFGADAKMNPPLRGRKSLDAVRAAIADGTIDIIATDHAPHDPDSKGAAALAGCFPRPPKAGPLGAEQAAAFTAAANGIIGLETALGLAIELVHDGLIGPLRLAEMMSLNPARLLRLSESGRLAEGYPADITVVDPEAQWEVRPERLRSLSRNTPFRGRRLKGRAMLTMVRGRIVYDGRKEAA